MSCEDHYKDLLRNENLKSTKHRSSILEALEKNEFPLSAEDLYLKLKEKGISISLSTVYRVLEALVQKDLATKSNISNENKAVYELSNTEHRHHLMCVKCRKMVTVYNCPLGNYEKFLEDHFSFTVKGHKLEVYGYCETCKNNKEI